MAADAERLKSLFTAASALSDPAQRAAFLDRECGGDAEQRGRVEAMLRTDNTTLLPPAAAVDATSAPAAAPATPTEDYDDRTARVGSPLAGKYKLVQTIGEGGMGSVYMAQQTEPVKRSVAVKVIKAGMDSKAVLARFEAERQALAMMDHPNIARVLDAGTTGGGRPFFVMELVRGVPITQYCDDRKLTPRQRLELFVPVCQAIQHAHQKGIIHRDIKPSNVLVAMYDDRAVPKVIDFGVAKAAGQSLTEKTLMTGLGAVVGTAEYMSPEQANLNNLDIDTRSDVYSLGVLLYELLTGSTPVDRKSLGKAALLEILRIVREVEVLRPSARLSTIDTLPSVAANRGTEPAKLSRLMKGELDWVVLKALEKDRSRRYDTANGLVRDIQRYLADEVVEARPPSTSYRLQKFVRRNRATVLAGSAVAAALLLGAVAFAWQARIATWQKQIAQDNEQRANENYRLARQAVDDYLTRVSENTLLRVQPSRDLRELRKQLLEDALKFYQTFIDQHQDDPALRRELARAYARVATITDAIGSRPDALAGHSKALEIRRALADADPNDQTLRVDVAETLYAIGNLQRSMGRSAEAIATLEEAHHLLDEQDRANPDIREANLLLAKVNSSLGSIHKVSQHWDLARPFYNRANDLLKRLVEADPAEPKYLRDLAWSTYLNGNLLSDPRRSDPNFPAAKGSYNDALSLYRRLIEAHPREPDYPIDMAQCYVSLASLAAHGDRDTRQAVRYLEQALGLQKKVVATHPTVTLYLLDLSSTYYNLAYQCSQLPERPEVVRWYRESITIAERLAELDPENVDFQDRLGRAMSNLGYNLFLRGDTEEAAREYLRAVEIHRRVQEIGSNLPSHLAPLAVALEGLGATRAAQRKPAEALPLFEAALEVRQKLADANPTVPDHRNDLAGCQTITAMVLLRLGRTPEARAQCERAVALRTALVADNPDFRAGLAESSLRIGQVRLAEADGAGAATIWKLATELFATDPQPDGEQAFYHACCHALLSGEPGKPDEIDAAVERALLLLRKAAELGYRNADVYRTEMALDPLRGRDDFKKLMADLEAKIGASKEQSPPSQEK